MINYIHYKTLGSTRIGGGAKIIQRFRRLLLTILGPGGYCYVAVAGYWDFLRYSNPSWGRWLPLDKLFLGQLRNHNIPLWKTLKIVVLYLRTADRFDNICYAILRSWYLASFLWITGVGSTDDVNATTLRERMPTDSEITEWESAGSGRGRGREKVESERASATRNRRSSK